MTWEQIEEQGGIQWPYAGQSNRRLYTDGHFNTDTVPGLINGYLQYFRWQYVQFGLQLLGKPEKGQSVPSFADACQVQAVCDAIYRSGLKDGELTKVKA